MNLTKYKNQHAAILIHIYKLRELSRAGIVTNASEIAKTVIAMSAIVKLHLSIEDKYLYPELFQSKNSQLGELGRRYQSEMAQIASAYIVFAGKWNDANKVTENPEGFRAGANEVLKVLYERIAREDSEFYPIIEAQ